MPKPTVLAPWANDANYPAGVEPEAGTPTKVAYTLGQETVGWRPKGKPPAQELNTWMYRVGLWIAWLNAIWDDLGNLTLDNDASVKVSGTGKYKRGERVRPLAVTSGKWISDDVAGNERCFAHGQPRFTSISAGGGWGQYAIPLVVEQYERIKSVSVTVRNQATDVLNLELWKIPSAGGAAVQIGATQTSTDHLNSPETLTIGALTELVDGTAGYQLYVYCTAFANNPTIVGASQTTDVPD